MAKYSLEQLRSKVWGKQEQAIRDLKASNVPARGADYELRQHGDGWQLMSFDDAPGDVDPSREQRVIDALRKKPGAKPKGEPEVILAATKDKKTSPKAAAVKAPAKVSVAPPASPDPVPSEPPDADPPPFDMSPAPSEGEPYELVLREVDGAFPRHASVTSAINVSRKLKAVVHVRSVDGSIIRVIDAAAYDRYVAQRRKASTTRRVGKRDPAKPSKFSRIIALLSRPEGASAVELEADSGWSIGQRHINRAAKISGRAFEKTADKHWRLKA